VAPKSSSNAALSQSPAHHMPRLFFLHIRIMYLVGHKDAEILHLLEMAKEDRRDAANVNRDRTLLEIVTRQSVERVSGTPQPIGAVHGPAGCG